jgi:serine/threonine protein kinase
MNHKIVCDKADPSYESCMRVFSKDLHISAKPTPPHKHTLANRIKQFHYLENKLSLLEYDDCLETKNFTDGTSGYTIRNIINLKKRIGTKSKYGIIYLTAIPSLKNTYPIATKVMPYNMSNIYEISIMSFITKYILLKKISRHFLMIYGGCMCSKHIADKLKLISINELADGDLKMLMDIKDVVGNSELMFNIFIQTFISAATFHNLVGYVHRDAHYGNFLYQTNSEKGYYHYIFNGKDYYLKSCAYNITIYDFGFARELNSYKNNTINGKIYIYKDYVKIINAFIKKTSNGWNTLAILDKRLSDTMIVFKQSLYHNIRHALDYDIKQTVNTYAYSIFAFILENIFLKHAPQGMFITSRPPNVINAIPFLIDK